MTKLASHKFRAQQLLRSLGWTVDDVERQLRHSFTTVDLFNFADLLCVKANRGTLAVQVTSPDHVSHRVGKLLDEPNVVECIRAGWEVEVWGFRDAAARDGSLVLARSFELAKGGRCLNALEGSNVL
jgi:hypothetical protein